MSYDPQPYNLSADGACAGLGVARRNGLALAKKLSCSRVKARKMKQSEPDVPHVTASGLIPLPCGILL